MSGLTMTADIRRLMNDKPALPKTQEGLEALQVVVDRAIRTSRNQYWCERLEDALNVTMPHMAAHDGHFYASDDKDCRDKLLGQDGKTYNDMGYNSDGFDRDGWDRRGNPPYDKDGNPGLMANGFTRAYDKDGYDCNGYSQTGYDRNGNRRKGRGSTLEEQAVATGLVNPTTAVLGPDGKLYPKGTTEFPAPVSPPVKRAPRKATTVKATGVTIDMLVTNNA